MSPLDRDPTKRRRLESPAAMTCPLVYAAAHSGHLTTLRHNGGHSRANYVCQECGFEVQITRAQLDRTRIRKLLSLPPLPA